MPILGIAHFITKGTSDGHEYTLVDIRRQKVKYHKQAHELEEKDCLAILKRLKIIPKSWPVKRIGLATDGKSYYVDDVKRSVPICQLWRSR